MKIINLDFGDFQLEAELRDTAIAGRFYNSLPREIELTHWGREMYGSIEIDLGSENPVPTIPAGGLAYTNKGNYLCIFYGQKPAWPVEHIGSLTGNWQGKLSESISMVTIRKKGD